MINKLKAFFNQFAFTPIETDYAAPPADSTSLVTQTSQSKTPIIDGLPLFVVCNTEHFTQATGLQVPHSCCSQLVH